MRILVYPHDLAIGGSQINAIDLAAGVARAGHDVVVYGVDGPLTTYIASRGLRFISARRLRYRPAPSRIIQLAAIARRERLDLIHAYEWPPCLDAYFGAHLGLGVPLLCTYLGMTVTPMIPPSVPLIMGTADLVDAAAARHHAPVWGLEPPVDTQQDHPGIDGSRFRRAHGVTAGELLVVTVSRLAINLKLDALVRAIDATDYLAGSRPVRLVIVGGGPAEGALAHRIRAVNARWGRSVVTMVGSILDPREAYAAADVVVGMGGSALRALAIGKPVVVQGERAFSETFRPETLDLFLRQGFYGQADDAVGVGRLVAQIDELLGDKSLRQELGDFGRNVVVRRFGLDRASNMLLEIYDQVRRHRVRRMLAEPYRAAIRAVNREIENHHPGRKQASSTREHVLLSAAGGGIWPPGAASTGRA